MGIVGEVAKVAAIGTAAIVGSKEAEEISDKTKEKEAAGMEHDAAMKEAIMEEVEEAKGAVGGIIGKAKDIAEQVSGIDIDGDGVIGSPEAADTIESVKKTASSVASTAGSVVSDLAGQAAAVIEEKKADAEEEAEA